MQIKKIAFLFPGQGSQSLSVLNSFKKDTALLQDVFHHASEILGYDLWHLAQKGPIEKINRTVYTQPLLLTASVALWELWKTQGGILPDFLAGHSLGEYSAYVCAGALTLEAGVSLVAKRAFYMESATDSIKGAMAVIMGLSAEEVIALCAQAAEEQIVTLSSYNAADQVVISGHEAAVRRVMRNAKSKKARFVKQLPISVPAHCALMKPAARQLAVAVEEVCFQEPTIPVLTNLYAQPLSDVKLIRQSLVAQLYQPVHWQLTIDYLLRQRVNYFVECGPNQVLTHLTRRIVQDRAQLSALGEYERFQCALRRLV